MPQILSALKRSQGSIASADEGHMTVVFVSSSTTRCRAPLQRAAAFSHLGIHYPHLLLRHPVPLESLLAISP